MSNRFNRFDCHVVSPGKVVRFDGPTIRLVKSIADQVLLNINFPRASTSFVVERNKAAVIVCDERIEINAKIGAWHFHQVPVLEAAKMLAFLDSCTNPTGENYSRRDCAFVGAVIETPVSVSGWNFDRWLISCVIGMERGADALLAFLRREEAYGLVRFLLRERAQSRPVASLAARYGLSESYFRRLCRQSLGRGLKRELRLWRASESVLDLIDSKSTMTELAMMHGFASSSHFSREIKDLFGISPCQFRHKA